MMTGERENEHSLCALCGGVLEEKITTRSFVFSEGRVAVVRNLPAEVCQECHEAYISSEVNRALIAALRDKLENYTEPIEMDYSDVAPVFQPKGGEEYEQRKPA